MVTLARKTLSELIQRSTEQYHDKPAFMTFGDGRFYDIFTYADVGRGVRDFASVLQSLSIKRGDRIMILSENRPQWPIAYFGCVLAGVVTVPVLTDFMGEHIHRIAEHAEIAALCATDRTMAKILSVQLPPSIPIIHLDKITETGITVTQGGTEVLVPFKETSDFLPSAEEDLATIIYTSGTTGNSKGVMLSHRSIIFEAEACRSIIKMYPRDRFLSVLPLAHTYEFTIGLIIAVMNGASTTYLDRPPSPAALLPALQALRPTIMLTVPLIIEKAYRTKIAPQLQAHPLYKFAPTRGLAIRVAGKKLMANFGGAVRFFGIGGAALAPEVERFLYQAKFPYAIGYGLTETAPLLAGAPVFKSVLRSTGPALRGVELRIVNSEGKIVGGIGAPPGTAEHVEGEIQARGPNIMLGYYKEPEKTREVFTEDGWFKTGDLGSMDRKGRLFIRGRLKALILGPSGENIYPEEIEGILNASDFVGESLVYAGEKGELVALIVLNEKVRNLFAAAGEAAQEAKQYAEQALADLKALVNKRVAAYSRLHRIEIQDEPFEKTATQKIKRFLYPKRKN